MVDHLDERRDAAVVHIRSGDGDVAQRGDPKLSDIFAVARMVMEA